jgi:hypothetical protein
MEKHQHAEVDEHGQRRRMEIDEHGQQRQRVEPNQAVLGSL